MRGGRRDGGTGTGKGSIGWRAPRSLFASKRRVWELLTGRSLVDMLFSVTDFEV